MNNIIIQQKRWVLMLATLIIFYTPYLIVNHLSSGHQQLPFIFGEENLPFLPWTVVIYLSLFLQGIVLYWKVDKKVFPGIFKLLAMIMTTHIVAFLLSPTEYPRGDYDSENFFLELFRLVDSPGNCFPSLHVGTALVFAICYQYGVKENSRTLIILFWIWSIMIILSTLTTKQHYIMDIIGSFIADIPIIWIYRKTLQPRK